MNKIKNYLIEFFGSFIIYLITGFCYLLKENEKISLLPLAFIISCTYSIFSIFFKEKNYFNIAITFGYYFVKKISFYETIFFMFLQFKAAILSGTLIYYSANLFVKNNFDWNLINSNYYDYKITIFGAIILETVIISLIAFTYCTLNFDQNNNNKFLFIGVFASYMIGIITSYEFSGASLNPMKTLGFCFVLNSFKLIWIYTLIPIVSSIGVFLYYDNFILYEFNDENNKYFENFENKELKKNFQYQIKLK